MPNRAERRKQEALLRRQNKHARKNGEQVVDQAMFAEKFAEMAFEELRREGFEIPVEAQQPDFVQKHLTITIDGEKVASVLDAAKRE